MIKTILKLKKDILELKRWTEIIKVDDNYYILTEYWNENDYFDYSNNKEYLNNKLNANLFLFINSLMTDYERYNTFEEWISINGEFNDKLKLTQEEIVNIIGEKNIQEIEQYIYSELSKIDKELYLKFFVNNIKKELDKYTNNNTYWEYIVPGMSLSLYLYCIKIMIEKWLIIMNIIDEKQYIQVV